MKVDEWGRRKSRINEHETSMKRAEFYETDDR